MSIPGSLSPSPKTPLEQRDVSRAVRRLPHVVKALLQDPAFAGRVFVAGGFIRACVSNEAVHDIDLFVPSAEVAHLLATKLEEATDKECIETANAITIRTRPPVQIIHRWTYATPAECVESFDFTIASAAMWWDGTVWQSIAHPRFYADLAAKRLVYLAPQRNEDAGGSMVRVLKFYQKGYRIPLDSLGAVISRLVGGMRLTEGTMDDEVWRARVLTGLLIEVDPQLDPNRIAHLPRMDKAEVPVDEQEDL